MSVPDGESFLSRALITMEEQLPRMELGVRLKPPEQREIVTARQLRAESETTLGGVAELIELRSY